MDCTPNIGPTLTDDFKQKCQSLALDPTQIRLHQTRIKAALAAGKGNFISIADTCRLNNGGVLPLKSYATSNKDLSGIISFVPAAGASSRYTQPFSSLLNALHNDDTKGINSALNDLKDKGFGGAIIPPYLKHLLSLSITDRTIERDRLLKELTLPKAFFPCVVSGENFLDIKLLEDNVFSFFEGLVIVCSPDFKETFEQYVQDKKLPFKTKVIEQGAAQCTIRFDENAQPIFEDGNYSRVPAGHGMLTTSLSKLQDDFPKARTALIRNIDNVIGCTPGIRESIADFLALHNIVLNHVETIRQQISQGKWDIANQTAEGLIKKLDLQVKTSDVLASLEDKPLWQLQDTLFHCSPGLVRKAFNRPLDRPALDMLFNRPVNTLGQVPNTLRDVGGTPVFARFDGELFKICLEVPHASDADRKKFLEDPSYATHFNPVFALAELRFEPDHYSTAQHSAWLLAKKTHKGETVYYHESVLYELLGNNILANAIFVEIPRTLFNPHKSLEDCQHHTISDWFKVSSKI